MAEQWQGRALAGAVAGQWRGGEVVAVLKVVQNEDTEQEWEERKG